MLWNLMKDFLFVLFCPPKVNFRRQGCGTDKICQSNLKLSYQFGTRPPTSDLFTPLPKLVSDIAQSVT